VLAVGLVVRAGVAVLALGGGLLTAKVGVAQLDTRACCQRLVLAQRLQLKCDKPLLR